MTLELFAHPFSSYCQKALIALHEYELAFEYRMLDAYHPDNMAAVAAHWPYRKFPLLLDHGRPVREASIIIEYLTLHHSPGEPLIPVDASAALDVRFWDRFFDTYVATPQQKPVADRLRSKGERDPAGVHDAHAMLETSYAFLDRHMAGREWVAGRAFSMADCAAAPQLFYADWTWPIDERFVNVIAYRERLKARPSFARCIEDARPFRPLFPLGAPDRD